MAIVDAVFGSPDQGATPQSVERRRKLAEMLMGQAAGQEKITSPWQVVGKLAQGLAGGYMDKKAGDEEAAGQSAQNGALMQALSGYSGGASPSPVAPQADAGASATPSAMTQGQAAGSRYGNTPQAYATSMLGKNEVPDRASIQDYLKTGGANLDPATTAWCAAFVNSSLGHAGVKGTGSNLARSFMNWGQAVDKPEQGDVAVFQRGDPKGPYGHVGFYQGMNPDGTIKVLGGNQGNSVSYENMPATALLGYRRAVQEAAATGQPPPPPPGAAPQQPQGVQVASADPNFAPQMPPQGGQPSPIAPPQQPMNERTGMVPPQQPPAQPPQQIAQALQGAPQGAQGGNMDPRVQSIAKMLQNPWTAPQGRAMAMQLLSQDPNAARKTQLEIQKLGGDIAMQPGALEAQGLGNQKTRGELGMQPIEADLKRAQLGQVGRTGDMNEFEYGEKNPAFFRRQDEQRRAGAQSITVQNGGTNSQVFDTVKEQYSAAQSAVAGLRAINEARKAVDGGIISGAGADASLGLAKVASFFGADPSKVQNTETFRAAIAPQVAAVMKSTVGNQNISNSDREFAEKAAGGSITLDEGSIKRLLGIMEKAQRAQVKTYQDKLEQVYPKSENGQFDRERALFGVQSPDPYVSPMQPPTAAQPAAAEQKSFATAPAMDTEMEGYIYQGGDPAQQTSWKKK